MAVRKGDPDGWGAELIVRRIGWDLIVPKTEIGTLSSGWKMVVHTISFAGMALRQFHHLRSKSTLAGLLAGIASALIWWSAEGLSDAEEGSGSLTGPFIHLALIGSALLMVGAFVQLWRPRTELYASLVGVALTSPLLSWLFAAGEWCSALGACYGTYPIFRFDPYAAMCLTLALLSIAMQASRRRG